MRSHIPFDHDEHPWLAVPEEHASRAAAMATASPFAVHGFDVSSYQPAGPDFTAGGRQFAVFKASEATSYRDPHFSANRAAARAQGMAAVGIYMFARPAKSSADDAFATYMSMVGKPGAYEFAVCDYEVAPWDQAWACRWADLARAAGFHRVVFYSYAGMLAANRTDQIAQHFDDLWIAAYSAQPPRGDRWRVGDYGWTFWQHTDGQASVPGNDGPWDCSAFYGSIDQLRSWVSGTAPAPFPDPQPPAPPAPTPEDDMENLIHLIPEGAQAGDPQWLWNTALDNKRWIPDPATAQVLANEHIPSWEVSRDFIDGIATVGTAPK